jgi:hypothetical protein
MPIPSTPVAEGMPVAYLPLDQRQAAPVAYLPLDLRVEGKKAWETFFLNSLIFAFLRTLEPFRFLEQLYFDFDEATFF